LRSDPKKKGGKWHGFGQMTDGFNMLDPIKATIVTPGLNLDGKFDKTGIPASVLTKFLTEHGVVVEKTGLYSFFIMFTIGITKGRWNSLLTALQQFKDDYDRNQPIVRSSRSMSAWACEICVSTFTRCMPNTI
jgi:ornithine decarboxylase/lysine decarboxylase/arginine decarboxylase